MFLFLSVRLPKQCNLCSVAILLVFIQYIASLPLPIFAPLLFAGPGILHDLLAQLSSSTKR